MITPQDLKESFDKVSNMTVDDIITIYDVKRSAERRVFRVYPHRPIVQIDPETLLDDILDGAKKSND